MNQLKLAQQKFKVCQSSVHEVEIKSNEPTSAEVLIPLTSSVYVPGKLAKNLDKVLIDIGTGYFVEKVHYPNPMGIWSIILYPLVEPRRSPTLLWEKNQVY